MDEPQEEMTSESLALACAECYGLIDAILRVAPVKTVAELSAFLDATRQSPVHQRMLLDLLKTPKTYQARRA